MSVNKLLAFLFLAVVIVTLLLLSYCWFYHTHLRVDIYGQYLGHVKSFAEFGNLAHLGYNEYQPVAVLFFISFTPLFKHFNANPLSLVYSLYGAIILIILACALLIYYLKREATNVFIFALILLFSGPIVLHRFDLLVFLMILLVVLSLQKGWFFVAGAFMSLAIMTKIYPVIFVPYILFLLYKNHKRFKSSMYYIAGHLVGAAAVVLLYNVILGADFYKIYTDFMIHSAKPLHAESVWATAISLVQWAKNGIFAIGGGDMGIFGIQQRYIYFPKWFYNYFWIIPIAIYYAVLYFKNYKQKLVQFSARHFYALPLIFLATSKILCGQYLGWFALPFCLISIPKHKKELTRWTIHLVLILLILALTQFVYPLNYDSFINFYQGTKSQWFIFAVLAVRNLFLIFMFVLAWGMLRRTDEEKELLNDGHA